MRTILNDHFYTFGMARDAQLTHCLITRFNMVLPRFREVGGVLSEQAFSEWLDARVEIFRTVCLPSIVSHTERPDHWFIGFDSQTKHLVGRVLDLINDHPFIEPVWQEVINGEHEGARSTFVKAVRRRLQDRDGYVITTRLDNDDALNRVYGKAVRDYAAAVLAQEPSTAFWISFPVGVQYDGRDLYLKSQNNNAFLSKVEPVADFLAGRGTTALAGNHGHVFSFGKVYLPITRSPMWLQNVHGTNVRNKLNASLGRVAHPEAVLRHFLPNTKSP